MACSVSECIELRMYQAIVSPAALFVAIPSLPDRCLSRHLRSVRFCRLACCGASAQFVSTPRRAPVGLSLSCIFLAIAVVPVSVLGQSAPLFGRIVCFLGSLVLSLRLRGCVACVCCNGRPGSNSSSSSNLCSLGHCTAGQRWHCLCPGMTHIPDCSTVGATANAAQLLRCAPHQRLLTHPLRWLPLPTADCCLKAWTPRPSQEQLGIAVRHADAGAMAGQLQAAVCSHCSPPPRAAAPAAAASCAQQQRRQ